MNRVKQILGRTGEEWGVDVAGHCGFPDRLFLKLEPSMSCQLVLAFVHSYLETGDNALMDEHSLADKRSSQAGHGVKMMGGGHPYQPVDSSNEPNGILSRF
jgi:hypothetical protein